MKQIMGGITAARGFFAAGLHCGIKHSKPDLALVASAVPAAAAAVFTTNLVQAAPLEVDRQHLAEGGTFKAIVINSGNANACTGERGRADAREMTEQVAQTLGCSSQEILVASTGVIGVNLPMEKIDAGIPRLKSELSQSGGQQAARAILTTDTFPKEIAVEFELGGKTIRLGGMAKGSGMIHPNMATMLAFLSTDLRIQADLLQQALQEATAQSFNMISVDGDTSTNDLVIILANGLADNPLIASRGSDYHQFCLALNQVCRELAKLIVKDGEGASKFVEIKVVGACSQASARKVARSVASSNLVKSALFGEDANWGRIMCAAGYSGATFEPERVAVFLGDLQVAEGGRGISFDEAQAKEILSRKEIMISLDLGAGAAEAVAWTCDLTFDYVKINASYRS